MKKITYVAFFIVSVIGTYKVTFDMTQEIMGALYIQKHITDHKVHSSLVNAFEHGDIEKAKKIAIGLKAGDKDILETLIKSVEAGSYTKITHKEIEAGKQYLSNIDDPH